MSTRSATIIRQTNYWGEEAETEELMRDRACKAEAENAKLRELVEYLHRCFVRGHDWGPYCAGETVWVEQRMRELGIEVDE